MIRGRSSSSGRYRRSSSRRIRTWSAGCAALVFAQVGEDEQDPGTLDVAEELVPEAPTLRRPFDQAGDVGDDELDGVGVLAARASDADDAEMGLERREGVVGDLRLGGGDRRHERRLAGVREPDESDVGHELELEAQPVLLAELGLLGEGRRPQPVAQETGVSPPAPPARRSEVAVAASRSRSASTSPFAVAHDRCPPGPGRRGPRRCGRGVSCRRRAPRRRRGGAGGRRRRAARRGSSWPRDTTSPPRPPSPPSGPPRETCASLRNETAPAPPLPPFTCI